MSYLVTDDDWFTSVICDMNDDELDALFASIEEAVTQEIKIEKSRKKKCKKK